MNEITKSQPFSFIDKDDLTELLNDKKLASLLRDLVAFRPFFLKAFEGYQWVGPIIEAESIIRKIAATTIREYISGLKANEEKNLEEKFLSALQNTLERKEKALLPIPQDENHWKTKFKAPWDIGYEESARFIKESVKKFSKYYDRETTNLLKSYAVDYFKTKKPISEILHLSEAVVEAFYTEAYNSYTLGKYAEVLPTVIK